MKTFGMSILDRMGLGHRLGDIVHLEHVDGKQTVTYRIKERIKVMLGSVQLEEVPDASADTITVKLTDGSNDISDTLTFTEGTDIAGTVKTFNMDKTYWEMLPGSSLSIVVAGTTTTLGEVIVQIQVKRVVSTV